VEQHLRRLLDEISAAMGRAKHHEEREDLSRLHGAVERRLAEAESEKAAEEHSSLVDRLEEAEVRLETDHPTLAEALRDAIQALSSAGI
jgi:predicted ATPase